VNLWTIGHSNRSIETFLALLQSQQIELLADVRRFPGSRRYPQFNQLPLSQSLAAANVGYVHLPELGGRRPARPDSANTAWRNAAFRGYADYMDSDAFRAGIGRLLEMAATRRTVVTCAETLWWQCHRSLIADYLKAAGHAVYHILSERKAELHPFTSAARIVGGALSYRTEAERLEFRFPEPKQRK